MGRLDGLTDAQRQVIDPHLPKEPEKKAKTIHMHPGGQCDVPKGEQ